MSITVDKLLSREELGEKYLELEGTNGCGYGFFSLPKSDKEIKANRDKMRIIEAEVGEDFIRICRLKKEIESKEDKIKDVQKNNDELENRIERLEGCVKELYSNKKSKADSIFYHCESKIPTIRYQQAVKNHFEKRFKI